MRLLVMPLTDTDHISWLIPLNYSSSYHSLLLKQNCLDSKCKNIVLPELIFLYVR